ncbi:hypothetical protein DUI87_17168 [Hirundo rustica rustica]|uniref:Uncharacterized protein n=1 Tax=Hirundo rustica rustica TaxID=333673 RepID=A0A3M0K5B7_HIRRU|nr:hypothetical protein DUI87_17168 [Hirundo rustica rustica]
MPVLELAPSKDWQTHRERSPRWSRFVTLWGPKLEQAVSRWTHPEEQRPTLEQFVKNCCLREEPTFKKVMEVSPAGPHAGAGQGPLSLSIW